MWTPRASGEDSPERQRWDVECSRQYDEDKNGYTPGCHPEKCGRAVFDNFVTKDEVSQLRAIVDFGMTYASPSAAKGGPTIMDINSGFVRDPESVVNMYNPKGGKAPAKFTSQQYDLYRKVIERIRTTIVKEFGGDFLHLTAPTFITREVGSTSWEAKDMHDVYWHPHIDKNNTEHYDYSGLLYLADHEDEFQGGKFAFIDGVEDFQQQMPCIDMDLKARGAPHSCKEYAGAGYCKTKVNGGTIAETCPKACKLCDGKEVDSGAPQEGTQHSVEPMAGRLVVFTSGRENLHQVKKVTGGTRYVMSLWFTCNGEKQFNDFLDGKVHERFAASPKDEV